jgi:hypothetical protein
MVLPLLRLHDVRGERSNVPRDSAAPYEAEELHFDKFSVNSAQHECW